jgi:hypothetical protein
MARVRFRTFNNEVAYIKLSLFNLRLYLHAIKDTYGSRRHFSF